MSWKCSDTLKAAVQTRQAMFAYDNFHTKFKTAQPTLEHTSPWFSGATSATVMCLFGVDSELDRDALKWSDNYWKQSSLNSSPSAEPLIFSEGSFMLLKDFIGDFKIPSIYSIYCRYILGGFSRNMDGLLLKSLQGSRNDLISLLTFPLCQISRLYLSEGLALNLLNHSVPHSSNSEGLKSCIGALKTIVGTLMKEILLRTKGAVSN
jgi:hypothetical protein